MTADLVQFLQFLRARLDEDERVARDCSGENWWGHPQNWVSCPPLNRVALVAHDGDRTHIARNDPARVLAEVTWRRIIVGNYAALLKTFGGVDWAKGKNDPVMSGTLAAMETLHSVLRAMATVYADHPDYREEWKL